MRRQRSSRSRAAARYWAARSLPGRWHPAMYSPWLASTPQLLIRLKVSHTPMMYSAWSVRDQMNLSITASVI